MRKLTLKEMQKLAESKGGVCLSKEYINTRTKLRWRCREGHEWEARPGHIKRGRWCPICGRINRDKGNRLDISEMREIAKERGGECLSNEYVSARTKLRWRCEEGHEWNATPNNIKNDHWCPYCAGVVKLKIKDMHELAKEHDGKCLSKEYINNHTKLKWMCKEGHEWEAISRNVRTGRWCPYCARNVKLTMEDMHELAKERDGKCLSKEYTDNRTKLKWVCKEGHVWEATPGDIRMGHWCPSCSHIKTADAQRLTIEEMQEIAKERRGKCLSREYINANTKLKWECKDGHIWEARPADIKSGKWCPYCSVGVSERICREIFERIFHKPFPKKRPKWLINSSTGKKMELDGYCAELGLAFEYQGIQHYESIEKHFHKRRTLKQQLEVDKLKKKLCDKNNVVLIEIPFHIDYEDMPIYIIKECKKNRVDVQDIKLDVFDYKSFDVYSPERFKELQVIAMERGGKCLSKEYIDANTKLKWECREKHVWKATPSSIKNAGTWCRICGIIKGGVARRLSIDEMQEIARERDGECLSREYINAQTKLRWRCKEGHEWDATPNNIKNGRWCPFCAGKKRV